jgi:hypothetical protein
LLPDRVTGLGEFSPIGNWLLWAGYFENNRSGPNLDKLCIIWFSTKIGWAKFWAIFTNSTGHPACYLRLLRSLYRVVERDYKCTWERPRIRRPCLRVPRPVLQKYPGQS